MDKGKIVHFVGFVTDLDLEEFAPLWKSYMKRSVSGPEKITLEVTDQQQKGMFRYISQHECNSADFRFAFMKENGSSKFPDRKARVVQAGGYMPLQRQYGHSKVKGDVKVIAFLSRQETELNFYYRLICRHLNIYEAYFENCAYSYVMEFFLDERDVPELLAQLKTRPGLEAASYKECYVMSDSKRVSGSLL